MKLEKSKLEVLFNESLNEEVNDTVFSSISDLEMLIERHTQSRYGEHDYHDLFHNQWCFEYNLSSAEADSIVHFLVYTILNYPARAPYASRALTKCYHYELENAVCGLLKIYGDNDDFTTVNLCKTLLNVQWLSDLNKETQYIILGLSKKGLEHTRSYLSNVFATYASANQSWMEECVDLPPHLSLE